MKYRRGSCEIDCCEFGKCPGRLIARALKTNICYAPVRICCTLTTLTPGTKNRIVMRTRPERNSTPRPTARLDRFDHAVLFPCSKKSSLFVVLFSYSKKFRLFNPHNVEAISFERKHRHQNKRTGGRKGVAVLYRLVLFNCSTGTYKGAPGWGQGWVGWVGQVGGQTGRQAHWLAARWVDKCIGEEGLGVCAYIYV